MKQQIDPKAIPARACTLSGGMFELQPNGDGAKSRPVTLLARTNEPVEHWFWGPCIHDFAGMMSGKERIPIDYCHDDKDIIGYANRREIGEDGLKLSGALVPWKDSDRATEVAFKAENGIPYEASITFGGNGLKYEVVEPGQIASANGREYPGPCVIFRQWPLRGVAICPHGADEHTAAQFSAAETFVAEPVENTDQRGDEMAEQATNEIPETAETVEAVETPVEGATELSQPVETEVAEVEPETEPAPEPQTIDATEFAAMVQEFGAEIASRVVIDGGGRAEALQFKVEAVEKRNAELEAQVAKFGSGGNPAKPSAEPATKKGSIWAK